MLFRSDYHHNFYAGIHGANMAGTWQAVVNGFAGLRCQDSRLKFSPSLPSEWESYSFKLRYKRSLLRIGVSRGQAEFTLEEGEKITFYIGGKEICIQENGGRHVEKI